MKVLVAGASGAIGRPLINLLILEGHEVHGITQSKEKALDLAAKGAKPIILNILDREAVHSTVAKIEPEIVIDMLTHLPQHYTPEAMRAAAEIDAKVRREGGGNLQEAAEQHHARRFIAQSSGFWYEPGVGLAEESTPFARDAVPGIAAGVRLYEEIESRVLQSDKIEGVALRFGFLYGPGTWFHPQGDVAEQVRRREFPIIGHGEGVWNFIHIEDAAKAAVSAIYSEVGAYNIVNNRPSRMSEWLPAFARYIGAEPPHHLSEEQGLKQRGDIAVYYATKLRGASNQKAKNEFNFEPRTFEWLL